MSARRLDQIAFEVQAGLKESSATHAWGASADGNAQP
jgi:hypothetical protein